MKIDRNSVTPVIEVCSLLKTLKVFNDTPENREAAISYAKDLWAMRNFSSVIVWQEGVGQEIFKRTTGHCIG